MDGKECFMGKGSEVKKQNAKRQKAKPDTKTRAKPKKKQAVKKKPKPVTANAVTETAESVEFPFTAVSIIIFIIMALAAVVIVRQMVIAPASVQTSLTTIQAARTAAKQKAADEKAAEQQQKESEHAELVQAITGLDDSEDRKKLIAAVNGITDGNESDSKALIEAINGLSDEGTITIKLDDGSQATAKTDGKDTVIIRKSALKKESKKAKKDKKDKDIISISDDASTYDIYHINSGDTLSSISDEKGVSVDRIAKDNDIKDKDLIYSGSSLRIYK